MSRSFKLTSNVLRHYLTKNQNSVFCNFSRNMCSAKNELSDEVIFTNVENKGVITLNRPKALNALNLSMVNQLYPMLKQWEVQKLLVIMKGAGGKSFCAGGDVKTVVESGLRGERYGHEFFKKEYQVNGIIGTYGIPYIAFIDGIVMGGGVGLSVHGKYRIATERTLFAMPETQIGLFPDVGGSYFLSRLPGKLGLFLGLTGVRLKGWDTVHAGIATHYCNSDRLETLENELLKVKKEEEIDAVLKHFANSEDPIPFTLAPHLENINKCFSAPTVEEIVARLQQVGTEWSQSVLNLLNKMSPLSMKVTKRELELGATLELEECLEMEYILAVSALSNKDFYEGVRALLIDKDQTPKWSPAKLEDVTEAMVHNYFQKQPGEQSLKNKL